MTTTDSEKKEYETANLSDVLGKRPPGEPFWVPDCFGDSGDGIRRPSLRLWCGEDDCGGERWFDCSSYQRLSEGINDVILLYKCRHCKTAVKAFALLVYVRREGTLAVKFGERPPFGAPIPAKLLDLAGADRELLLKGRRCENQGLGIAAFTYYRRVVENRKSELFDQIIRVAKESQTSSALVETLERAKAETQFDKAMTEINPGVPESLRIGTHNPLKLLHSALSEGIHAMSDERCLELATHVRTVLTELTERMHLVLREDKELRKAVSALAGAKQKPRLPKSAP